MFLFFLSFWNTTYDPSIHRLIGGEWMMGFPISMRGIRVTNSTRHRCTHAYTHTPDWSIVCVLYRHKQPHNKKRVRCNNNVKPTFEREGRRKLARSRCSFERDALLACPLSPPPPSLYAYANVCVCVCVCLPVSLLVGWFAFSSLLFPRAQTTREEKKEEKNKPAPPTTPPPPPLLCCCCRC